MVGGRKAAAANTHQAHARAKQSFDLLTTPLHHLMKEVDEIKSGRRPSSGFAVDDLELTVDSNARSRPNKTDQLLAQGQSTRDDHVGRQISSDKVCRPARRGGGCPNDGRKLTPQRVHREVMTWLKEWDKCVFKRVPPKKRKADDEDNGYAVSVPTSIPAPPANSALG
jgi:chromosome transmission fidelity protein 18